MEKIESLSCEVESLEHMKSRNGLSEKGIKCLEEKKKELNKLKGAEISTKALVEELSKRAGVERIDIDPHDKKMFPALDGPMIVLKITD